jgi:hypothetical protein
MQRLSSQQSGQEHESPAALSEQTPYVPAHTEAPMHAHVGAPPHSGGAATQWYTGPSIVSSWTHT